MGNPDGVVRKIRRKLRKIREFQASKAAGETRKKRAGGPGLKPVPPAEAFGAMPLGIDPVPAKR